MMFYVSNTVESYKDTIIGNLRNVGTSYFLLQIVQCWHACVVDKENWDLSMDMFFSGITPKYYSRLGFLPIKHNE